MSVFNLEESIDNLIDVAIRLGKLYQLNYPTSKVIELENKVRDIKEHIITNWPHKDKS